jgi:D-3-phosphoglycerate dehydrogenase
MKALVTAKFPKEFFPQLHKIATDVSFAGSGHTGHMLNKEQMIKAIGDAELVIDGLEVIDAEVMDACPNLKIIACCRNEAFASIDIEAATARGIPVLYALGRNAISVAEFTIGLLLAVCKNISQTDYILRHSDEFLGPEIPEGQGDNPAEMKPPSYWSQDTAVSYALLGNYPELYHKKFGQIGYGTIGREVAKRAVAFDMEILISDPYIDLEKIKGMNARLVDLPTLMRESDFISINCNVNPTSINLINRKMLGLMKPTAYIVNTARAPLMDYEALFDVLKTKKIAGAALDVYPIEPLPKGNKLLSLDNIVLTPHFAGQAKEIETHQTEIILKNLNSLLHREEPRAICNRQVLGSWFNKNRQLIQYN